MTRLATSIRRVAGVACHVRTGVLARPILGWSISSVKSCPSGQATKNRSSSDSVLKVVMSETLLNLSTSIPACKCRDGFSMEAA